jgi:hypothetical protein
LIEGEINAKYENLSVDLRQERHFVGQGMARYKKVQGIQPPASRQRH